MEVNFFNNLSDRVVMEKATEKAIKISFSNLSNQNIDFSGTSFKSNEKYFINLQNATIIGNRSCLKDDCLYTDLPVEWDIAQVGSYIERIRNTHKGREFEFLSDINVIEGRATLKLNRPYMRVEEPCIFVGCVEAWNFGFFFSVLMFKIHLAQKISPQLPFLVPITKSWQVNLLRYVFPAQKFIFYDPQHPVDVANAKIIGWPNFPFFADDDYLNVFRSRKLTCTSLFPSKKIYFSRSRFNGGGERVNFSAEAESILMRKGYMPLFPEEMSYSGLHAALSSCTHLAVESGSALFNALFLPANAKVFLFESRKDFLNNHAKFISSLTDNGSVIYCDQTSIVDAVSHI